MVKFVIFIGFLFFKMCVLNPFMAIYTSGRKLRFQTHVAIMQNIINVNK